MSNKLIQQYGEDIRCYRIRTARHKKRMQYEDFDKHLIQINKEEKKLYQQRRNLGWEPITPPVQKGWVKTFVLREDVARSKQADFFNNILNKINTKVWSHRKDFLVRKRKMGRKVYVVKEQQLLKPEQYQFSKLKFTDAEKQLFYEELHWERWRKEPVVKYVFNEPWRFVLKVKPNIIDRRRKTDATIVARLKQIDNYLTKNNYHARLMKIVHGGTNSCRWCKKTEHNILKNKSLTQVLDGITE